MYMLNKLKKATVIKSWWNKQRLNVIKEIINMIMKNM
jgi:hypothetical protein